MTWNRTLCVAEKPSIARSITSILSGGQYETRNSGIQWVKNFEFQYQPCRSTFIVTCVAGHITQKDFGPAYRKWESCSPSDLFDAPIENQIPLDKQKIKENLAVQSRTCGTLVIWTDCDREGEAIGAEIAEICRASNPHISIKRARFSAIIAPQIHRAAQNLFELDTAQADAVEARIALDLRIGAAFTRMQTLALRPRFTGLENIISYGPCQFPTLGFVVSRFQLIKTFTAEQFWHIYLALNGRTSDDSIAPTEFSWSRGRLFDFEISLAIYEGVLESPQAEVKSVIKKPTKKWKPYPLTTVELQKSGSRLLKISPKRILDISDSLYQKGFLSYPRTETDQFDKNFDFTSLIEKQTVDGSWGIYAASLLQDKFSTPRNGKKNDQAHPPIHPTAHANNLAGDDKRVYEYVTRRFLACCSWDAEGSETVVNLMCGGEDFAAKGIVVKQRNYLDVFIYDKWNTKPLPDFVVGEQFIPSICELREGQTTKPPLLTEADLVSLMDKNGIGTDATIAQHIQTIIDREYVTPRPEGTIKYLIPSKLGIGLVEGYNAINFEKSLSKPQLRRETERSMEQVCRGVKTKNEMLDESIQQYKEVFGRATREFEQVVASVRRRLAERNTDAQEVEPSQRFGRNPRSSRGAARTQRGHGRGEPRSRRRGQSNESDSDPDDAPLQPARRQALSSSASQNIDQTPVCLCQKIAIQRSVTRETLNKGRRFWACGEETKCDFFQWDDDSSGMNSTQHPERVEPRRRMQSQSGASRNGVSCSRPAASATRLCQCDMTPVSRVVTKDGPNKGRRFWACPNSEKARCSFFEWQLDEGVSLQRDSHGSSQGRSIRNPEDDIDGDTSSENRCFKCGEAGHWSSACSKPTSFGRSPSSPSRNRRAHNLYSNPAGSASGPTSRGPCFKCGGEGHWSSDCQANDSASSRKRGKPTTRYSNSQRGRRKQSSRRKS